MRRAATALRSPAPEEPEWEYVPGGWTEGARRAPRGWNVDSVLDAYRTKLDAVREATAGTGPLAFITSAAVPFGPAPTVADQNAILAFAYSLALASRTTERVVVFDWGGGLAYFSFLARALLPEGVAIEYHCADLPIVCEYGRAHLPKVDFWHDDGWQEHRYDLVLASNSLQYAAEWTALVQRLAGVARQYLLLTQLPIVRDAPSFVVVQRARHYQYQFETEYPSWVFNRDELLAQARAAGALLMREFVLSYQPLIVGAPEQPHTHGYLFRTGERQSARA
jgi:putative methyltransferase (TIGR04325 family)